MKYTRKTLGMVFAFGCFFSASTQATIITYETQNIAGNTWEYAYTVSNDTLGFDIEEFSVYFTLGLTENLVEPGVAPDGWDPLVLQPDPLIPDDGLYDALALFTTGIAPGSTLGGFKVQFDLLGVGMPGNQFFEIVDPFTLVPLDSGDTQASNTGEVTVPEPASLLLMSLGLLLFGAVEWKKRRPNSMIAIAT